MSLEFYQNSKYIFVLRFGLVNTINTYLRLIISINSIRHLNSDLYMRNLVTQHVKPDFNDK